MQDWSHGADQRASNTPLNSFKLPDEEASDVDLDPTPISISFVLVELLRRFSFSPTPRLRGEDLFTLRRLRCSRFVLGCSHDLVLADPCA